MDTSIANAGTTAGSDTATPEVNPLPVQHAAVKIPPFSPNNLTAWLAILEGQFALCHINSPTTQFYHALCSLPPEIISRISPKTLEQKQFFELKGELKLMLEPTQAELFENLITRTKLTGKPSLYLHEIQQMAAKVNVHEDLVRHKFIQALPAHVIPIIASQKDLNLSQLATLADELISFPHFQAPTPSYAVASNQPHPLPQQVLQVPSRMTHRLSRCDNIPFNVKPFRNSQRPKICRGHIYFANASRNCKPWCQWPNKPQNLTILPNSRPASPVPSPQTLN